MSKIVIIGAGAMGSAFALPCLDNNHDINIVGTHLENDFIDNLQKNHNFHPGLKTEIPQEIKIFKFEKFDELLKSNVDLIVLGISSKGIEVDIIIQNVSEDKTTDFTFTVKREKSQETKKILSNLSKEFGGGEIELNEDISKVSLVGVGMKSHAGVAATMFKTLAEKNINIEMISTSEIKISVVVKENLAHEAVKSLHDAFNLEN